MVAFTEGDEGSDDVVTRRVAVIEGLISEPVSEGVDAEGSLLDEADTEDTTVNEAAEEVTPEETTEQSREDESHEDDRLDVVAVLPDDDRVFVQVSDVGTALVLGVLLENHPSHVRVEKTLADRVRILFGIGVTVVSAVTSRPPSDGAFDGTGTNGSEVDLERSSGLVGRVSPQTMVAGSDTEASVEVVDDGEDGRVEAKRNPVGGDEASQGDEDDEDGVEPVDVLVPVGPGHGQL